MNESIKGFYWRNFERIYKHEGLLKYSKRYGQETKQGEPKELRNHHTGQH